MDAAYAAGAEHATADLQEIDELHVTVELTHQNVILGLFGIDDYVVTGHWCDGRRRCRAAVELPRRPLHF